MRSYGIKFNILFIIVFLLQLTGIKAQSWEWAKSSAAGSGTSRSVTTDPSGNIYIVGNYDDGQITFGSNTITYAGQSDSYLVKYDPNGNVLWVRNIGSACGDFAVSVCTDASGNVFVTGFFCSASLNIGGFIISGYSGSLNIFLAKYDPDGTVLWAKGATGTTNCDNFSNSVATDSDGNSYITGSFTSSTLTFGPYVLTNGGTPGSNHNIFLAKFDPAGNIIWAKKAGEAGNAKAYAVCTDSGGNAFVTGGFQSGSVSFDAFTLTNTGFYDSYLVKYDPAGTVLWAKSTTCTRDDEGKAVAADASGNIYLTGYFSSANVLFDTYAVTNTNVAPFLSRENGYLVKYDSNGNIQWAKNTGGTSGAGTCFGYSVSAFNTGVYVSGQFSYGTLVLGSYSLTPAAPNSPMFITKYNTAGDVEYATYLESGGTLRNAVKADQAGNLYVTSSFGFASVPFYIGPHSLTVSGINTVFIARLSSAFVLPVTLINFKALANSKDIRLSWETAEEINITEYIVERSSSAGSAYLEVGRVRAKGGSLRNEYAFTDASAKPGINYYYRLAVTEQGRISKYSEIRSAKIQNNQREMITFANPTNGMLNLQFHSAEGPVQIKIVDSKGRLVTTKAASVNSAGMMPIDIHNNPSGIYWIYIQSANTQCVKKLVKY